mgnify:CR=1 FL=1
MIDPKPDTAQANKRRRVSRAVRPRPFDMLESGCNGEGSEMKGRKTGDGSEEELQRSECDKAARAGVSGGVHPPRLGRATADCSPARRLEPNRRLESPSSYIGVRYLAISLHVNALYLRGPRPRRPGPRRPPAAQASPASRQHHHIEHVYSGALE